MYRLLCVFTKYSLFHGAHCTYWKSWKLNNSFQDRLLYHSQSTSTRHLFNRTSLFACSASGSVSHSDQRNSRATKPREAICDISRLPQVLSGDGRGETRVSQGAASGDCTIVKGSEESVFMFALFDMYLLELR